MGAARSPLTFSSKFARVNLPFLLIWAVLLVLPQQARADSQWDAIHFTCIPDLSYFSLETLRLEDVEPKNAEVAKQLESQNGLYEPKNLLGNPYKCVLPTGTITIEIADYIAPHYPGECSLDEYFDIVVRIDGKNVHRFNAYGQCWAPSPHLIEINRFNHIRDCTLSPGHKGKKEASCELIVPTK